MCNPKRLCIVVSVPLLAMGCGTDTDAPTNATSTENSVSLDTQEQAFEPSADFIACFESSALEHPYDIVKNLATDGENLMSLTQLTEDESLVIASFLQSLDDKCSVE